MLSEPASANSAGSLFHSGIVWLVNENFQSSVLALCSLNLCRWVRRVRPSAISMQRSSGVTATSPCTTLYIGARRWSCRRASDVGHFNLARSSVMLACCRGPTPHIHLMARFWIFSKAYLSLLVCGSHMVAAYSAVGLAKLKYAVCFSCVGHFLRFLRINPRRLLHLFAMIVMWSESVGICATKCLNK